MTKTINVIIFFAAVSIAPMCVWAVKEEKPGPEAATVKELSDTQQVIETLNETLTENRKLKQELAGFKEGAEAVRSENDLLKSQVRDLQRQMDSSQNDTKTSKDAWQRSRLSFEKAVEELKAENERLAKQDEFKNKNIEHIKKQNEKLKELLNRSILEDERDEYLHLIQNSKESSEKAVKELAQSEFSQERMKAELANAYYALANMKFAAQKFKEAAQDYEKALALNEHDAWSHHNLGIIYDFYLHDSESAIFHYGKYLNLKAPDDDANKIRERVLELELGRNVIPPPPLDKDFYVNKKNVEFRTNS